jgi:hypothetical protein
MMARDDVEAGEPVLGQEHRSESHGVQLLKATAPVISLGLMAVLAVLLVTSEQSQVMSVRAQAGSWAADHPGLKLATGTSKLDWGGSEEFMDDDMVKVASNQGNLFEYGMTPPPINKGFLDEMEIAQGQQTQETKDNAALAMGEEIQGKPYYTNETFWREGPAGYGYWHAADHAGSYYH